MKERLRMASIKKRTKRLNINIPETLYDSLDKESVTSGITKSMIVASLLFTHYRDIVDSCQGKEEDF